MTPDDVTSDLSRKRLAEIFDEHADYDMPASVVRARVRIKAGRMLLRRSITSSSSAARGESVEVDQTVLEREVRRTEQWLARYEDASSNNATLLPADGWRDGA